MTNEEQQQKITNLENKINDLEGLFYKNNFSALQVYDKKVKLNSGLVYNVVSARPTYTGMNGETVLVDDSSSVRKICSYLNSTWVCQDYEISQASGFLSNVVEDTTPQLGGYLDTNGQAIWWEGGKIQRHAISKTLGTSATDLFKVDLLSGGSVHIRIYWNINIQPNGTYNAMNYGEKVIGFSCDGATQSTNTISDVYTYEIENGGATITFSWTATMSGNETITISGTASNNSGITDHNFVAIVEILNASTGAVTYTEL